MLSSFEADLPGLRLSINELRLERNTAFRKEGQDPPLRDEIERTGWRILKTFRVLKSLKV